MDVILTLSVAKGKDLKIRTAPQLDHRRCFLFYQLLSCAGALMILIAYAAQQANRMAIETIAYQGLNFVGGLFLFITGMQLRQAGFILVEGVWTVISLVGLWRVITRRS